MNGIVAPNFLFQIGVNVIIIIIIIIIIPSVRLKFVYTGKECNILFVCPVL
jgi:hypothetical protein